LQAQTWKRHTEWPTRDEDPVTVLMFMAWAAARRSGLIEATLKFEAFVDDALDLQQLGTERVDPTRPAPGAG
jgi:hypothetical protein